MRENLTNTLWSNKTTKFFKLEKFWSSHHQHFTQYIPLTERLRFEEGKMTAIYTHKRECGQESLPTRGR